MKRIILVIIATLVSICIHAQDDMYMSDNQNTENVEIKVSMVGCSNQVIYIGDIYGGSVTVVVEANGEKYISKRKVQKTRWTEKEMEEIGRQIIYEYEIRNYYIRIQENEKE